MIINYILFFLEVFINNIVSMSSSLIYWENLVVVKWYFSNHIINCENMCPNEFNIHVGSIQTLACKQL